MRGLGGGGGEVRLWQHHDVLTCQVSDNGPGLGEIAVALPSPDGFRASARCDASADRPQPWPGMR
ncbi:hypothetical protein DVH21_27970 [Micromonospora aurantiaca]|uniref:Uncharacterized protein n=1 Tax=Micromonospora aurantiaca (nom. illeg.) TaxID=47850 RepID=A0A6N3K517_9ACTN|nr:hypothetical protein DVH21_27970 [Micromonospora aurantiaca]